MPMKPHLIGVMVATIIVLVATSAARAHPHVIVEVRSELVFDKDKHLTAVRHVWRFDPAYSAFATQGLDVNRDGRFDRAELAELADVNIQALNEFDYFTFLDIGQTAIAFETPREYWLAYEGGQLTLFFTLPLEKAVAVRAVAVLEVVDPEYFVAFTMTGETPFLLSGASTMCDVIYEPPQELDSSMAVMLAQLPPTVRELPPQLQVETTSIAHRAMVQCQS